nr:probable sodium/metabolite cotransporter BASS4, chloroplastic [Tanacetum cinerariifolium]
MIEPAAFLVAIMMGMLLHLILLVFNAISIRCLCAVSGGSKSIFAKKENSTALLLVASQKALPVLVAVVDQLGATFGEPGLLIIPCVAAHLNQIIVDSFLISFWNKKVQSLGNTKVT